jgi:predicted AlkP superfamily phosphohydrolase/phosphomutase
VLGLDGATFDLIERFKYYELPNIKKMMKEGVWGKLESTLPPITGPAWVSFATGKNPGKHGCYDFVLPKESLGKLKTITSKDIKAKTFYEILNENGKECIIVNLPGTYPPRIKETVITSILTPGDDFVFPRDLINEIPELRDYRIVSDKHVQLYGTTTAYIEDVAKLEETRFKCGKKLFAKKDWDFFFLLFSGTDWLQHKIYGKLIHGNPSRNSPAMRFYRKIDEYIGWFVANAPDNGNILIVSDHGFEAYKKSFSVNKWLIQEGYLVAESKTRPTVPPHRSMKEIFNLKSSRKRIKLPTFLANHKQSLMHLTSFYRRVRRILPFELEDEILQARISKTIAYNMFSSSDVGGIQINDRKRFVDGVVEPNDYEYIRDEIIDKLEKLVNTKTGERVINKVWKKEEVYQGAELDTAPDIVFTTNKYAVSGSLTGKILANVKGNHHALNGIFVAYGPDIAKSNEVQGLKICDVAPTILHMLGLPVPRDMDGRVLTEIFKDSGKLSQRPVKYQEVDSDQDRVKSRIRKLKESGRL